MSNVLTLWKIVGLVSILAKWASTSLADGKISFVELANLAETVARDFGLPVSWDVNEPLTQPHIKSLVKNTADLVPIENAAPVVVENSTTVSASTK